jgi:hypothetical protein
VGVLDRRNYLLEDLSRLLFREPFSPSNQVEEFPASCVLKDHEDLGLCVNELKQLNSMRVVEPTQDLQLSLDLFEDSVLANFLLVQNLNGHFVAGFFVIG